MSTSAKKKVGLYTKFHCNALNGFGETTVKVGKKRVLGSWSLLEVLCCTGNLEKTKLGINRIDVVLQTKVDCNND